MEPIWSSPCVCVCMHLGQNEGSVREATFPTHQTNKQKCVTQDGSHIAFYRSVITCESLFVVTLISEAAVIRECQLYGFPLLCFLIT